MVKKAHKQIKEEKKQKILKKKMKVLREMKEKDKDGTFMTGAGLHLEDIEIEDEDNIPGFDPLLEDKGELDDIMEEIKRDIFKMKNVRKTQNLNYELKNSPNKLILSRKTIKSHFSLLIF